MLSIEGEAGGAPGANILEEKQKLQKSFRRFDIFFFLICALVGVDTIGSAAKSLAGATTAMAKTFTEQTFLQGLNNFMQALNDPGRFAENYAKSTIASESG